MSALTFGTLVLTLAMSGMEMMMIVAVMYTGKGAATLARDTMMAILMIGAIHLVLFSAYLVLIFER